MAAALVALAATPVRAAPAVPLTTRIDATLDASQQRIAGQVRQRITNTSVGPLTEVLLWLYPNHLAARGPSLGDVSFHWLYPDRFSAAGMRLGAVVVDGQPATTTLQDTPAGSKTLARIALRAPLAPGGTIAVDVAFATEIPTRFGSFGCVGTRCRLMGGFYPAPAHLAADGWHLDAAPARAHVTLALRAPAGWEVIANGTRVVGAGPHAPPAVSSLENAAYASIVTGQGLFESVAQVGRYRVRYLHSAPRPPSSDHDVLPYVREDIPGLVLGTCRQALEFLRDQGLGPPEAAGTPTDHEILLVEAPLRHELVQSHDGVVLVSDQIFRIFPIDRLRKYHHVALTRALYTSVLTETLRSFEAPPDIPLGAEVLAAYLADVFTLRAFRKIEYARDLLRPLDFLPAVDQLIYAPLIAASSIYFGDVADSDPIRDDVRRFSHARPSGQLIYNKLLDLLGPAGVAQLSRRVVGDRAPLREAAAATFGADLGWFWSQWLGPRPRVNYRLERLLTQPHAGGVRVIADVTREGDSVREPVLLRIEDRAGGVHDQVWSNGGTQHTFTVDLPAGLKSVEVDPNRRLIESAVGSLHAFEDPRTDNRTPRRWRLIYSGLGGLLNISQLRLNFLAGFLLKPAHDLRNGLSLRVYHSDAVTLGAGATYLRFFGRQANKNALTSALFGGISGARMDPSFGLSVGEAPQPGWRLSASAGVDHDDRDYLFDPWHAVGLAASAGYSLTLLEDSRLSQVTGGVEALRLLELAPGHVLALQAQAAATFGDIRLRNQLVSAGGPTGLRGYFADELLGRAVVLGRIQLRNHYVGNLNWNLLHMTSVRSLAGTLFADVAATTSCGGYDFTRQRVFADVGYSFRVLHDAFGVYQQLLSIDVAIPLNRGALETDCLGPRILPTRPPVVVLVSFLPNF